MRTKGLALVILCLLAALWAVPAGAQEQTGSIEGVVKDASGAVLPGVEVTATQTATSLARSVVTNETGAYTLANLPIGPYRLEAVLPGFRTFSQTGIVLQVGSSPSINPILEVGQVTEQVEVSANAALVETRNAGVSQVVENVRILELPVEGWPDSERSLPIRAEDVGPAGAQHDDHVVGHDRYDGGRDAVRAADADGDGLTYFFYDNSADPTSGHFTVNGVVQAAGTTFAVSAPQLAQTTFTVGTAGTEDLFVNVWDGLAFSGPQEFHIGVAPNHAPVITSNGGGGTAAGPFRGGCRRDLDGRTPADLLERAPRQVEDEHPEIPEHARPQQKSFYR